VEALTNGCLFHMENATDVKRRISASWDEVIDLRGLELGKVDKLVT